MLNSIIFIDPSATSTSIGSCRRSSLTQTQNQNQTQHQSVTQIQQQAQCRGQTEIQTQIHITEKRLIPINSNEEDTASTTTKTTTTQAAPTIITITKSSDIAKSGLSYAHASIIRLSDLGQREPVCQRTQTCDHILPLATINEVSDQPKSPLSSTISTHHHDYCHCCDDNCCHIRVTTATPMTPMRHKSQTGSDMW